MQAPERRSVGENTKKQRTARATRYEDYITRHSEAADAAGHREPYHLTYAKRVRLMLNRDRQQAEEKLNT